MRLSSACLVPVLLLTVLTPSAALPRGTFKQLISDRYTAHDGLPADACTALRVDGNNVYVRTAKGDAHFDGLRWHSVERPLSFAPEAIASLKDAPAAAAQAASAARTRSSELWFVTPDGAFRSAGGRTEALDLPRLYRAHQPVPHIDLQVKAVAPGGDGHVWLATDHGLLATDGGDWWHPLNRQDGVPYEDMMAITVGANGDVWGGTTEGAFRLRAGEWRYFWGKRWLPGNRVAAVAVAPDGSAWLATDGGVAHIQEQPITLDQKADHDEALTAARHNRRGYVTGSSLAAPGDPSAGFTHEASDNDGLWTGLYVAAESFRYAVTRSAAARRSARQSMDALLDLVRLTGIPGFPARAVIRRGESVTGYDVAETVRVPGETDRIWFPSPVDPGILCKGDTSSDEIDGHFFAWYVYYEHAAEGDEKRRIAETVRAVMNNILDHGDTLVGPTGRRTLWGVWAPRELNENPRWWEERGLNSLEILCYLKVASHICGDPRFSAAYDELIRQHHYLLNTLNYRRGLAWHQINHSDDQLAFLAYYPLLMLEHDPQRRAILLEGLTRTWEALRAERSPFFDFIYGAVSGRPCAAEEAVTTLQDWPWELIQWDVRNSHRHDVPLRSEPGIRPELDRVLPASESVVWRWASNPYDADGGTGGLYEEDAAAWLLPYWLGRFHRLLDDFLPHH